MLADDIRWRSGWLVKVTIATLLIWWTSKAVNADEQIKQCFKGSDSDLPGNVSISCPEGYIINIGEALLGRNKWGTCLTTDGDCWEKTRIFQNCEGVNSCNKTFKTYSPQCGYSTVLLLSYSCVQSLVALVASSTSTTTATTVPNTTTQSLILSTVQEASPEGKSRPVAFTVTQKPLTGASNSDDLRETGIIIGCVLASIVTVIALVVAIVMVIRRLLHRDNPDAAPEVQKNPSCMDSTCITLDSVPCFKPGSPDEQDGQITRSTKKTSSGRSFKRKMKPRMAPVGEESVDGQVMPSPDDTVKPVQDNKPSKQVSKEKKISTHLTNAHNGDIPTNSSSDPNQNVGLYQNRDSVRLKMVDVGNNNEEHKTNENTTRKISKPKRSFKEAGKLSPVAPQKSNAIGSPPANLKQSASIGTKSSDGLRPTVLDAVAIPNTERGTAC